MLIDYNQREKLNELFNRLKLNSKKGKDQGAKIEQILAYMEIIHSTIRKYSPKRKLVLVESCAGNCYLSFLVNYFYTHFEKRNIFIHCVDINEKLMIKAEKTAGEFGFQNMQFHHENVLEYKVPGTIDLVYSLHACDVATDGTLYLAIKNRAKKVLSVSCCQHSIKKQLRNSRYRALTKHEIYKDRLVYMVGDSLRALLMEMNGYKSDIIEFVSSRYTDKNIMLRADLQPLNNAEENLTEYKRLSEEFKVKPMLEEYLKK